jgi:AcrR family transcriptional regulator
VPTAKRPLIDVDEAVRTALAMIDEEGFASFSIEKLSKRLGVRGPSLYHHFTDRADLLSRVAQLILLEVPDAWDADEAPAWDEGLVRMAVALRRAILRHPNAGPILLEYFPRHFVLGPYEHVASALTGAGIPERFHMLIIEGIEKLTLGSALYHATFPDVDDRAYPSLARAVSANGAGDEEQFVESLEAFLHGVEARVRA